MTVLVIHGSPRKNGCSSNIARLLIDKLTPNKVLEIEVHRDKLPYCIGCMTCLQKGIENCPHSDITLEYKEKILEADVIIVASPVYILHMSAQLKSFFDHLPSMCIMHRPESEMFNKQLVIIGTSAGSSIKKTIKEIDGIFTFFGISKIYKLPIKVMAEKYSSLSDKKTEEINKKVNNLSTKILKNQNKTKINIRVRSWFFLARILQKRKLMSELDNNHWIQKGWLVNNRPWK